MTKPAPDEATLRCSLAIEEAVIRDAVATEIMPKNALAIFDAHTKTGRKSKPKVAPVSARIRSVKSRLGKLMNRLYDLESSDEPEKPLKIDLDVDLYQMEHF